MPQPAAVEATANELVALYRQAQERLLVELVDAVQDPRRWRQAARLRALVATHAEIITALEAGTRMWLATRIPQVHQLGAVNAARVVGSQFRWSGPHLAAVETMAAANWEDVGAHLRGLRRGGREAIREMARDATRSTLLEARTAAQSGRELERWARERGITSVTYSDGSRRSIGDYADTLARTTSANSYNQGTLTQVRQDGIEWVECFDGPDCGLTSHQDPQKANGLVLSVEVAGRYPLSHPRCARSWGPRPDITSQEAADGARQFTPEEQDQMAEAERQRAQQAPVTLSGRARASRTPREPRQPR